MRPIHLEDIGPHYAKTLRHWHDRFFGQIEAVKKLGYSDEFIRMWQFYLCYCESAFIERATGTVQLLFMRPDARHDSIQY
jgi:cyclopropane-fatty-acyl-phospholipid synthase